MYYLDNFSSPETFFNSEPLNSLSPYILNSSNEENNNFFIPESPIYEERKCDKFDECLISPKEKEENIFKSNEIKSTNISTNPKLYLKEINNEISTKKKRGRKKKDIKEKGIHNKYSADNIMRKIKSKFVVYIIDLLNRSLKNNNLKFSRLDSEINENLKKNYNIELFSTKIIDLILNSTISHKYRNNFEENKDKNKKLLKKIINEGKEHEVIKILNLTYLELFKVFRKEISEISYELEMKIEGITSLQSPEFNNINNVFYNIYQQEKLKGEEEKDIDNYISKIRYLCINYENWFTSKKGRNRTKNH